ncbi:MAG: FtsX-like permease family protein [Gammaproteobacteria bacterium]|nr:FtsX-like permease family protein [Gammaproteobacteria bacterium]
MQLNRLAWKNLWRNKRRTLITGFSISLGVFLSVTFTGTGDYGYTNMIDASATMGLGHVTVEAKGFNETPSLDKRLKNSEKIREQIITLPNVSDATVRIMGQAMFASASKSVGGSFLAINSATESEKINLMIRAIVEGELFDENDGRGIVIGSIMAEKLKLKLGKKIVYTTTDINGEIVGEVARISAIFKTGLDEVDGAMVLLPIDRVRKTLGYTADESSMITVIISDQRRAEELRDQLTTMINDPETEVLSWQQTQRDLTGLITIDKTTNYLSQVLVGLVIAAGILNTLLMGVMERTREFGIMMAVGMPPSALFRLVILESFWLAIVGLIMGVMITAPWYWYLLEVGLDFTEMFEEMGGYSAGGVLIDPIMHIRLFKESIIAILSGVFILTLISGLYPAWRAVKTNPVETLKTI